MRSDSFWVGGMECRVVMHGAGRGSPERLFPDVAPAELRNAMAPFVDADGQFSFTYSSLAVRTSGRVVLLDTGFPEEGHGGAGRLNEALQTMGVTADDVDAVVVSHGHLDHIGGLTVARGGIRLPAFGAARHFVHQHEFDYWTGQPPPDDGSADAQLRPLAEADRLELVTGEIEIAAGVRLLPTPGHTPGHLSVALTSNGHSALYVGDALAHEVNVANPDWNHFSDLLPGPAMRSRRSLVGRAARAGHLIIGSHMVTRGRVHSEGAAHAFIPEPSPVRADG